MKNLFLTLFLLQTILLFYTSESNAQVFNWAKRIETINWARPGSIALDSVGNIYISSYFNDTVSFGNFQLYSIGITSNYLAKYNQEGTLIWAKKYPGSNDVDIAVDKSGNIYISGDFHNTVMFDTIQLTSFGGLDIYMAKYDPDGNCLWAKHAGSTSSDYAYGIALDSYNNFSITGMFRGTAIFGDIPITSAGELDIYVAKFDPFGNCLWAKREGGSDIDKGYCIAADTSGSTFILASTPAPGLYMSYVYLAKYNSDGIRLWEKYEPGGQTSHNYGICTDDNGNLLIVGTFYPSVTLGSFVLVSNGSSDIFIAKYDPNGNCLWAKRGGGGTPDDAFSIEADQFGYSTITGHFTGTVGFGNYQLTACGGGTNYYDAYVVRYDPNGNCLWAKQIASTGFDSGSDVFVDDNGNSFISGYYHTNGYFGDIILPGPGQFIAKMPPNPTPVEMISFSVSNNNRDVILNWKTTTELNNRCFEVQRSVLAGEFIVIGFVKGHGTSIVDQTYSFLDKNLPGNRYKYRLKQVDYDGTASFTDIVEVNISGGFRLEQNYPNPFNPVTYISYSLPYTERVVIQVFDILGNEITTLVNELKASGNYDVVFNGSNLTSGLYFYKLTAGSFIATRKFVLLK